MDFHTLSRRDLQSLCKRNKIPANLTNIAMADALTSLQSVEGLAEVQEALQFQSPTKMGLLSPAIPRTGRRTTARKAGGPTKGEEEEEQDGPKERQASPLPRARRVTARAPEILTMAEGEDDVAQTPKAPTTRRRASKKDDGVADAPTGQKTAVFYTRRRAAPKEEGGMEVEKPAAGVTTGRRTRQVAKKEVSQASAVGDDLMSGGTRRSTRGRGRSAAVKMASLAKEEDENQTKEAEHPVEQTADEVADKMEEEKELGSKDQDCGKDQILDEKQEKPLEESFELVGEASEKDQDQEGDGLLSGFDDSPIRGLISDQAPKQYPSVEEIENVQRSSEEAIATDDGELNQEETEDSGAQSHDLVACVQTDLTGQPMAAESKESGEGTGEKDTGDNNDLGFNPANCEIAAEAAELEITVESPEKQPEEEDVTVESTVLDITVESPAIELQEKQPEEADVTAESTVLDITVESPSIEPPAKQPEEEDVTVESTDLEITVESPAVEQPSKQPEEEGVIVDLGHAEVVAEVASDGSDGEVHQVSVEVDELGADLSGNNGLAGEIAVEAIGEEESPSMQPEMADEVLGELMDGISDLKLSAGSEPPVAGINREMKERDDKENAALTETAADAAHVGVVGPRGKKFEDMSLRKLKAAYKYTLLSKGEGEEKRAALKAIDENKDAADAAPF